MIEVIKKYFTQNKILYSHHSMYEMVNEEKGEIKEKEVFETIINGEEIEFYPEDKPYPSCLIYGRTKKKRPIHAVIAVSEQDKLAIVITVYEPDKKKWINYRKRRPSS